MSASSKKKLRSEEVAAKLTEKQLAEQKEAKKLKLYTIAFAVVLAALVIVAAVVGISRAVDNSGVRQRNTVAATVGSHNLSNVEMNYFFIDSVNTFYNQNSSIISYIGLEPGVPMDQQMFDEDAGTSWADYFVDSALQSARSTYAVADEAKAQGYTLSEDGKAQVDSTIQTLGLYASAYGYSNADAYLRAMYGNGASAKTFREYLELSVLASEYNNFYEENLDITAEDIAQHDAENPGAYDGYRYNQYYLPVSSFEGDNAEALAEEAAASLTGDDVVTVEDFDAAIAALSINSDNPSAASSAVTAPYLSAANSYLRDWLALEAAPGAKTYVPVVTSYDDNGTPAEKVTSYYAAIFDGKDDNKTQLVNVRHILVGFEGGTTENGTTTYSDEEKAAASAKAEEILAQWKSGEATEESFAALAMEHSTDGGSVENGGLYENVFPGQMVPTFNDWCFDASRRSGDTAIVETDYGFHVMYFVGNADLNYREYLIRNEIADELVSKWYTDLVEACPAESGDMRYIKTDLALNG